MADVVGRLAPSPTGLLHLGHARTFLVAWWHARSRGGRVVLRVEDLDGPRVQGPLVDSMLFDLEWLGLDWDGAPILQSSRLEHIDAAARELEREGLAYACVCSRADLRQAQSAPQLGVSEARYPGTCRGRFGSTAEAERVTGLPAGLRFRVPPGPVSFDDALTGARQFDVSAEVGDFLVARKGGAPAYQLAVVVDDAADGVTEVVRGDDLLPSTARQLLLSRALGLKSPSWLHVPLVLDQQGRRLAKRTDALSLSELRTRGADPRSIVAWALATCGHAAHDRLTALDARALFDVHRLSRDPVRVDPKTVERLLD